MDEKTEASKGHLVKIIHKEMESQVWSSGLSDPGGYELHYIVTGRKKKKKTASIDLTQKPIPLLANITILIEKKKIK